MQVGRTWVIFLKNYIEICLKKYITCDIIWREEKSEFRRNSTATRRRVDRLYEI